MAIYWQPIDDQIPASDRAAFQEALQHIEQPVYVIAQGGRQAVAQRGTLRSGCQAAPGEDALPLLAQVPPLPLGNLGDAGFKKAFGLRYAYVCGAMANGITSVEMVTAAGQAGMIGFFGAAGLSPHEVESAIDRLQAVSPAIPFGFNLIHSPNDMALERTIAELYLRRRVTRVSASAYLDLTPPLVYYRVKGIHARPDGTIVCPNKVVAKVSRMEVVRRFLAPPPEKHLSILVNEGVISDAEAALARQVPMADAVTAEADSGGHTDNRPALALLPTFLALRDAAMARHGFQRPIPVGLGGGIATPDAAAAAFAMGAAYILTGSVNQACREAGTCAAVRRMLAEAEQADVIMAPAADMFEMGVKVQVLKRGTMFAMRAAKLYDLYNRYAAFEELPPADRQFVETQLLRGSYAAAWEQTKTFFQERDPAQIDRARKDPKHMMALVFRSYLGQTSRWAVRGAADRQIDYQIWCGPAMGAFNAWTQGSFLAKPENRDVVTVAGNLLYGAAVLTRSQQLRYQGVDLPAHVGRIPPMALSQIGAYCPAFAARQ
ncbi:MAG: PfaD family polyunsaturated fatty acid/polyketide biosynthesis protein [Desulfosarcinaceae bacterium]|nr:PfaD family polyunsaturated fatty acid/polyketide biosynthesis protein [Desulfosarcinaceae bacterium]